MCLLSYISQPKIATWQGKGGGSLGCTIFLHQDMRFNLEEPHKEKNMMNLKLKLARKEEHDEQHQRTMKREKE